MNVEYVAVTSQTGAIRTYTLNINRAKSADNKLLTFSTNVGELNKLFDPDDNQYTITVPEGTTMINMAGTVSDLATVIGLGVKDIKVGTNIAQIIVTSQTGETNIYTMTIERPASASLDLENLIPSAGTLEYDDEIDEYEFTVDDNISTISFIATPVDAKTTIEGTDLQQLEYGLNEITITVKSESGSERVITVKVTRTRDINAIIIEPEEIVISIGEEITETYTLDPIDTTYPEVEWVSLNESVATVDQTGKITGIDVGYAVIKLMSTHDEFVYDTITVNVISDKITSSIYNINRDTDGYEYIIGAEPQTPLRAFGLGLDNNPSTIHFFDMDDNEIKDLDNYIGSFMKVRLIVNNTTYDELTILVRGDADGDSFITAGDDAELDKYILGIQETDIFINKILDLDKDEFLTASDSDILSSYI